MTPSDFVGVQGICRCCGGQTKGKDVFEGAHRYYADCASVLESQAPIDSAFALSIQLLARVVVWSIKESRANDADASVKVALLIRGFLNTHVFQRRKKPFETDTFQAALMKVRAMATGEVDRPGDNDQRFRMLMRIRTYVEGILADRAEQTNEPPKE